MHSAIFEGQVKHRRTVPVLHAFRFRLYMLWLDLAELEEVFRGRWLWSVRRLAVARFRREDHFGDPEVPLDTSVRNCVQQATGRRPEGPIRLLTHLSYFGYCFNPVSFFYCLDRQGETVQTVVAEVTNTPWGERHLYVLDDGDDDGADEDGADDNDGDDDGSHDNGGDESEADERANTGWQQEFAPKKVMHVSPFMPMDVDNRWRFTIAGEKLLVHMDIARDAEKIFDATLSLTRRDITGRSLARVLVLYPLMTVKVIVAIHWQALRLWLKGAPVYEHAPTTSSRPDETDIPENHSCTPSH